MSLKLTGEGSLHHIMKHSVAVVVTLGHSLVVGVMMLVQEAVGSSVEVGRNLLDIRDSLAFCMLLTSQHGLLREQQ